MTTLDDLRTRLEAALGNLTPAKAQEMAKGMLEPNAAKEQVAKTAADILAWSQRNRERVTDIIRGEIRDQLQQMGAATQQDLDALKKRVRILEREAGLTASGRGGAKKTAAKRPTAKKPTAKKAATATPAGSTET